MRQYQREVLAVSREDEKIAAEPQCKLQKLYKCTTLQQLRMDQADS